MLVRIIKDWDYPDLMRQTPGYNGEWDGINFTTESVTNCDYAVVLNRVNKTTTVHCAPQNIWTIIQEPPGELYAWLEEGYPHFSRVYTQDINLVGKKYIYGQPALPWHIGKNYDKLKEVHPPDKPKTLSWVTSNAVSRSGHTDRMVFLDYLKLHDMDFDLWGKGFTFIDDKWDGIAPYHYSLAIENYNGPYYWSEKLADCYLSWTMPIYYGCTNIDDYFPPESMIKIDIKKPDEAIEIIHEAVQSDLWLRNRDAIAHARELVLDKHQFFPFVVDLIREFEANNPSYPSQKIKLPELPWKGIYPSKRQKVSYWLSGLKRKLFHG